jgi:hypothetical protein
MCHFGQKLSPLAGHHAPTSKPRESADFSSRLFWFNLRSIFMLGWGYGGEKKAWPI